MQVQAGRRAAVAATLAATLAVGAIGGFGTAPALAADPPGLKQFMTATARVESNGNHKAVNRTSGAFGRYQIMPSNWRSWARTYLGDANAAPTVANQEKVARGKMRSLYHWLGSWPRVSYWWLTGSSRTTAWSQAATSYVSRVMAIFGATPTGGTGSGEAAVAATRYSERSSTIDYTGAWQAAEHGGYAGGAVSYASADGATASITFKGSRIAWFGPVGPTRGKARVLVDGVEVEIADLQQSSFRANVTLYSISWKAAGRHTLTIEVIGTKGDRIVAIDELVVTE